MIARILFFRAFWLIPVLLAVSLAWGGLPVPRPSPWLRLACLAAVTGFGLLLRRWAPLQAGFLLASAGLVAGSDFVFDAFFRQDTRGIAGLVLSVVIAFTGLRSTLSGACFLVRAAEALIGFALPAAAARFMMMPGFGRRGFPWMLGADLAAVALLACVGRGWSRPIAPSWRAVAVPILLSIVLLAGFDARRARMETAREQRLSMQIARVPRVDPPASYDRLFFQRGISYAGDGPDAYYPEPAAKLLDELKGFGVDSIALIPYGGGTPDGGEIRFDPRRAGMARYEALGHLARARHMRILLKPQIWAGGFPGNIDVPDPAKRARWFASYSRFIEEWARVAARMHADLFCVGTEFVKMSRHEAEWRAIIGRVREIYKGPLVYAATQGEEFETLRFWDALDYIGLNDYYPLPDDLDTSAVIAKVEAVQSRFGKPVLLTEAGFASVEKPNREPWSEPRRAISLEDQARCYEAVLRAFHDKPWFHGIYWWKVAADGRGGPRDRSLTPWGKPAMDVLARWYKDPARFSRIER